MVKLYYTPTSCGASSFICAFLLNLNFECEIVDLTTHVTESGRNFYEINPKGNVPCLILDDGTILNENITCLEYIVDQREQDVKNGLVCEYFLAPIRCFKERYELNQLLSFFATELHPAIGMFFNQEAKDPQIRSFLKKNLERKMKYLEKHIITDNINKKFVFSNIFNRFTIADAYLHIILSWFNYVGLDLNEYPIISLYYQNICNLDYVKKAKQRMALSPKFIVE